jgi:hypothetical protein
MPNVQTKGLLNRAAAAAAILLAATGAAAGSHMTARAAQLPSTELLVAIDDTADPVVPGGLTTYAIEITNVSAEPIADVAVQAESPEGAGFAGIFASVGTWTTPANGEGGPIAVAIGTIEPGATVYVSFGFNLRPDAPERVDLTGTVTAAGVDVPFDEPTFVADVGAPVLRWELFDRPAGTRDGAPRYTRVERVQSPSIVNQIRPDPVVPGEYRVYRSREAEVLPIEENLFLAVPASQFNSGALAEPGYFYAVTRVLGGLESEPSNAVSYGAGEPTVEKLKVKNGKLTAIGAGFEAATEVTIGPLAFVDPPKVKPDGTKLRQAGRLSNGLTLKQVARPGSYTFFTFRNPNGGATGVLHGPTLPPPL